MCSPARLLSVVRLLARRVGNMPLPCGDGTGCPHKDEAEVISSDTTLRRCPYLDQCIADRDALREFGRE